MQLQFFSVLSPFKTSLLAKFHPTSPKLFFTKNYILDANQIINTPFENVSPLYILYISEVLRIFFQFFTCHLYFKKKVCTLYVHLRRQLDCTIRKHENVYINTDRQNVDPIFAFNELKSKYSKVLCESRSTTRVN